MTPQQAYELHRDDLIAERLQLPVQPFEREIPPEHRRYCWHIPGWRKRGETEPGQPVDPENAHQHAYVFDDREEVQRLTAARLCKNFGYFMEPARFNRAHVMHIDEVYGLV